MFVYISLIAPTFAVFGYRFLSLRPPRSLSQSSARAQHTLDSIPLRLLTSTSGNPVRCALRTQQVSPCPFSGFSAISCSGTPMSQILLITLSYTQGSRELPLVSSLTLSVTPWVCSFLLSLVFSSLTLSVFLSSVFLCLLRPSLPNPLFILKFLLYLS